MSLPASTARKLRYRAEAEARPVSSVVRDAVEAYVADAEPPEVPLPSFVGSGSGDGSTVADGRDEAQLAKALDREHRALTRARPGKRRR
ncbi:MAG TPA: hypothetical protein VGB64_01210 [Actinomycetota bacterium]